MSVYIPKSPDIHENETNPHNTTAEKLDISKAYGDLYISSTSTAETSYTSQVYTLISGTTTSNLLRDFTMPQDNRLTYTGMDNTIYVHCHASISFTVAANNVQLRFSFYKNGIIVSDSEKYIQYYKSDTSKKAHIIISSLVSLETGDYLEVYVKNQTGGSNMTAHKMNFVITALN